MADAPIDLEHDIEGVRIEVGTGWVGGSAYLRLGNRSPTAALCEANFRNGPESKRRRTRLEPEEERTLTFQPAREVIKLRIRLHCEPADDGDGQH